MIPSDPATWPLPPGQYKESDKRLSATGSAHGNDENLSLMDRQLISQYAQLLSRHQGQLPVSLDLTLQQLIRQLLPLVAPSSQAEREDCHPDQGSASTLAPLLKQVLPLIQRQDPALFSLPLATLSPEKWPAPLAESTPQGRLLLQWTIQLLGTQLKNSTEWTPALARQLARVRLAAKLPAAVAGPHRRLLGHLSLETLKLMLRLQSPFSSATPSQAGRSDTAAATPPNKGTALPVQRSHQQSGAQGPSVVSAPTIDHEATPSALPPSMSSGPLRSAEITDSRLALTGLLNTLEQAGTAALPPLLHQSLKLLQGSLQQPLLQPEAVEQWLRFLTAPLTDNSPLARNLQRWFVQLLGSRLQLRGELSDSHASLLTQQGLLTEAKEEDHPLLHKMTSATLEFTSRSQEQAGEQPCPCHWPLPPLMPGGPPGQMGLQCRPEKDGPPSWLLTFYLEPEGMGPLQIRAQLRLPEIGLLLQAERTSTVDRIRSTLPLLESRFRSLGLQPTGFHCRHGKVTAPKPAAATSAQGVSIKV